MNPQHRLKQGTLLRNRYLIGKSLGQGGFGITYIGCDTLLQKRVAAGYNEFGTYYVQDWSGVGLGNT